MRSGRPLKNGQIKGVCVFRIPQNLNGLLDQKIPKGQRTDFILNLLEIALNPEAKEYSLLKLDLEKQVRIHIELEVIKEKITWRDWNFGASKVLSRMGVLNCFDYAHTNQRWIEIINEVEKKNEIKLLPKEFREFTQEFQEKERMK
jgi:hypothetical protein